MNSYLLTKIFCDVIFFKFCIKSECQQLICEILRATPEAASADATVQTARLASKAPSKEKRYVPLVSYFNVPSDLPSVIFLLCCLQVLFSVSAWGLGFLASHSPTFFCL